MSRRQSQSHLPGFETLKVKHFGGAYLKGNPREQRPLSIKRPLHLVLRSTLATGKNSFLHPSREHLIEHKAHELGRRIGVRVYRYANSGNHLHLIVKPLTRKAFRAYIRALSGIIARITLGAQRNSSKGVKFWDARPFTRIIEWGRDYSGTCRYLVQNTLEAIGFIPYVPREYGPRAGPA